MYKSKIIDYNVVMHSKLLDEVLNNIGEISKVNTKLMKNDIHVINTQYKISVGEEISQEYTLYLNEDYTTYEDFKIYVCELLNDISYNLRVEFIYEDLNNWNKDKYEVKYLDKGSVKVLGRKLKGAENNTEGKHFEINLNQSISFYGRRVYGDRYSILNYKGDNSKVLGLVCLELGDRGILNSN